MALDRRRLLKPLKKLKKLVDKINPQATPDEVHDLRTNTARPGASHFAPKPKEIDLASEKPALASALCGAGR